MRKKEERKGKEKRRKKRRDEPRREKERRKEEERRDEKRRDETRREEKRRSETRREKKRKARREETKRGGKNVIKSRNSHLAGAVGNNARITISNVYCCLFQIILNLILYSCNYVLFPVFVGCNSPNSSVPIVHFVAYLSPGNYANGCDLDGWMEG